MSNRRHWILTSRDVAVLEWLGRWRGATAPQIAREFTRRHPESPLPLKSAERRLRALKGMGLVESRDFLADQRRVHWLTREGMRAVGLSGSVASPKLAELTHDLSVIDLAHYLMTTQPEHELVTEQEVRRMEPNPAAGPAAALRSGLEMGTGRATGGRAFPDLVSIVGGSQVWVHELERSRKPGPRLGTIMRAYIYADHIAGAVYWAYPHLVDAVQAAAEEANRAAQEIGRTAKIRVRRWEGS